MFDTKQDDLVACKQLIKHGSHSFFLASLILPKRIAIPATALYAFCRIADDLIDEQDDQSAVNCDEAIQSLAHRLDGVYAGNPQNHPEDRALCEVVHHFKIPRSMPNALIEGLAWDNTGRRYETLSDLYDYAARVAGCVGAMMSLIMGRSDMRAMARACDLGVAMQLTNIARDIGDDARMGRLYLPRAWFHEANLDPDDWLKNPVADPRIAQMCARLLNLADQLFRRADSGVSLLPLACRPGIRAARIIYSDIGHSIKQQGYMTVHKRAVVPKWRKVALLGWAGLSIPWQENLGMHERLNQPPLRETRYLLNDVDEIPHSFRMEWLLNLFMSLEKPR